MAMSERIRRKMELSVKEIGDSENLSHDEKDTLIGLITDAGEATNGLGKEEKLQKVSEVTFTNTTILASIKEQLNANNKLTNAINDEVVSLKAEVRSQGERDTKFQEEVRGTLSELNGKMDSFEQQRSDSQTKYEDLVAQVRKKRDIRDLDWKNTLKLILVKPWVWIFLGIVCFSPKGIELVQMLLNAIPK